VFTPNTFDSSITIYKRINTITKTITGIFGMICLLIATNARAQSQWSNPATVGSRPEVVLLYSY